MKAAAGSWRCRSARGRARLAALLGGALVLALHAPSAALHAAEPAPAFDELRLRSLAELWGEVAFRHPRAAQRDAEWEAAVLRAISVALVGGERVQYAAELAAWGPALGDPALRVREQPATEQEARSARWVWHPGECLELELGAALSAGERVALAPALARARVALLDLRAVAPSAYESVQWVLARLLAESVELPQLRFVEHDGFATERASDWSPYTSAFRASAPRTLESARSAGAQSAALGFVIAGGGELPAAAWGLVAARRAALFAPDAREAVLAGASETRELGEGLALRFSIAEPWLGAARSRLQPDPMPLSAGAAALLARAQELAPARAPAPTPPADGAAARGAERRVARYTANAFPAAPERVLAGFRLWNAIRFFYAYPAQLEDWDGRLAAFLRELATAADARAYQLALARMAAGVRDAHTAITGPALPDAFGDSLPPLELRVLEGVPVVTRVFAGAGELRPGDALERIDGRGWRERFAELAPYRPASHAAHQPYLLCQALLRGPHGSALELEVRAPDGRLRRARLLRARENVRRWYQPGNGRRYRLLGEGIGYLNLTELQPRELRSALALLSLSRALVVDLRGYPRGTARQLAGSLRGARAAALEPIAALVEFPLVSGIGGRSRRAIEHRLDAGRGPGFPGPLALLIDERTQSQGEHSALWLERAARELLLVGSASAGADGNLTSLALPGGVWFSFGGAAVRHGDGRPLQGVGLVPDVAVRPTRADVVAGRDAVLEAAIDALRTRSAAPAARARSAAELARRAGTLP